MLFFIVVFGFMAEAQIKFDYLSCQKVLSEQVAAIQLKIWNGVVEEKLTPYQYLEMDSVLSIAQVRGRCAGIDTTIALKRQSICGTGSQKLSVDYSTEFSHRIGWDDFPDDDWEDDDWGDDDWDFDSTDIGDDIWRYSWQIDPIDSVIYARETKRELEEKKRYNLKESFIRFNFDSTRDITGLIFGFESIMDAKNMSTSYKLTSIGLLSNLLAVHGIVFENYLVFCVDYNALKTILTNDEIGFLNALVLQRSNLGDFLPELALEDRQDMESKVEALNYSRFINKRSLILSQNELAVLAAYNAYVFNSLGNEVTAEYSKLLPSAIFYKDSLETIGYQNILYDLREEVSVNVPNPENPDDPYDLMVTVVSSDFSFDWLKEPWIVRKSKSDYLVRFDVKDLWKYGNKEEVDNSRKIYFSYSSIKYLLPPHDRVVLEALLREIAK